MEFFFFFSFQMIVSCGLNVGKLLRVLHEGLLKEETHCAPLVCLLGNEVHVLLVRQMSNTFYLILILAEAKCCIKAIMPATSDKYC